MSITLTEMPDRLRRRPQFQGMPIPFSTLVGPDGMPDYKVTDVAAWHICMDEKLCFLCAEPLGYWCWYLGAKHHFENEIVYDLGAHEECCRYAAHICPYIAYGKAYGTHIKQKEGVEIIELAPRELLSPKGVDIYLFRGRTSAAKKVHLKDGACLAKTGRLYDAVMVPRRAR